MIHLFVTQRICNGPQILIDGWLSKPYCKAAIARNGIAASTMIIIEMRSIRIHCKWHTRQRFVDAVYLTLRRTSIVGRRPIKEAVPVASRAHHYRHKHFLSIDWHTRLLARLFSNHFLIRSLLNKLKIEMCTLRPISTRHAESVCRRCDGIAIAIHTNLSLTM